MLPQTVTNYELWPILAVLIMLLSSVYSIDFDLEELRIGDRGFVNQSQYTDCCWNDEKGHINLHCIDANCHIRIKFFDIDLPPDSSVKVMDEFQYLTLTATRSDSAIIESSSKDLTVSYEIKSTSSTNEQYAGFRFKYEVIIKLDLLGDEKPFSSSCPSLPQGVAGGMIELGTEFVSNYVPKITYYCVWHIRVPQYKISNPDLNVFLRLLSVPQRGRMEVRKGLYSMRPIAVAYTLFWRAKPHLTRFESTDGFYILAEFPVSSGILKFLYGDFTYIPPVSPDTYCIMQYGGHQEPGFRCQDGYISKFSNNQSDWCVPTAYLCDSHEQCPSGLDERIDSCLTTTTLRTTSTKTTTTSTIKTSTSLLTTKHISWCESGVRCEDGRCVQPNEICDNILHCMQGQDEYGCRLSKGCQESQLSCGISRDNEQCIKKHQWCDGIKHCDNEADEAKCSEDQKDFNGSAFLAFLALIPIVMGLALLSVWWRRKRGDTYREQNGGQQCSPTRNNARGSPSRRERNNFQSVATGPPEFPDVYLHRPVPPPRPPPPTITITQCSLEEPPPSYNEVMAGHFPIIKTSAMDPESVV